MEDPNEVEAEVFTDYIFQAKGPFSSIQGHYGQREFIGFMS